VTKEAATMDLTTTRRRLMDGKKTLDDLRSYL
jgi:hypothetical protein